MKSKKILLGLMLLLGVSQAFAQNDVRLPQRPNRPAYHDHTQLESGFWCAVEAQGGSSILFDKRNAVRAGVSVVGGYMFNEFIKIGMGLGGNCYLTHNDVMRDNSVAWTMPLYVDLRGNFASQDVRNCVPYWSVDFGAAINDGVFISPTIGLRFGETRNSWLLGLSYTVSQIDNNKSRDYPATVGFASLKVGFEF
jgi:hypothetical protein